MKTVLGIIISLLMLSFAIPDKAITQMSHLIGPPGGYVVTMTIDQQHPKIIYAATNDGYLFKSNDGGQTSTLLNNTTSYFYHIIVDPLNVNILYSSGRRSSDGGMSWEALPVGYITMNPLRPQSLFAIIYTNQIERSTDGGNSWTIVKIFSHGVASVEISPFDTGRVFAVANDSIAGLYESTDGGEHWNLTQLRSGDFGRIFFDMAHTGVVYAGTSSNLLKSNDGGETWDTVSTLPGTPQTLALNPRNGDVYLGTSDGTIDGDGSVFRSTDGGLSWTDIGEGLLPDNTLIVTSLAIDSINIYAGTYYFGVFKSTDEGSSWQSTNTTLGDIWSVNLDPHRPQHIYAGTDQSGMLYSTNGGSSWEKMNLGVRTPFNQVFKSVAFDPTNDQILYSGNGWSNLMKSTNAGQSWLPTPLSGDADAWDFISCIAIHPQHPDTLYAGMAGLGLAANERDVYRSTDGGASWTNLNVAHGEASIMSITIDPHNTSTLYVSGNEMGLYKSSDDGITWVRKNNGLIVTEAPFFAPVYALAIDPDDSDVLYLVQSGIGNTPGGLLESTDQGDNWTRIDSTLSLLEPGLWVSDVKISNTIPRYLCVSITPHGSGSTGGVFISKMVGGPYMWERVLTGGASEINFDPFNPDTLYAARATGISIIELKSRLTYAIKSGWNLISLMASVSDNRAESLYPTAISSAFNYSDSYHSEDSLEYGVGYWLKFPSIAQFTVSGEAHQNLRINMREGWNIIGAPSLPFPVSMVSTDSPGVSRSQFFKFDGKYIPVADTLYPGSGYWVKLNKDANIIMDRNYDQYFGKRHALGFLPESLKPPNPPVEVDRSLSQNPSEFGLGQNYPNPFNPTTSIRIDIPNESYVSLTIYNTLGQIVARLLDRTRLSGSRIIDWTTDKAPTGLYFYRLQAYSISGGGEFADTKKMILLK